MNQSLPQDLTPDPYAGSAADRYDKHHRSSWRNRLTSRRELAVLGKALRRAAPVATALDLPCGAGRFWPVFQQAGVSRLIAGDISEGMLYVAQTNRLAEHMPERLESMSAFDVNLPDGAVDFAACMRFLHHLSTPEDRGQVLSELRRVSRKFVAISLWTDGNLGAIRRRRRTPVAVRPGFGRRICRRHDEVEAEFREAGFDIVEHYDVWPKLSMWRLYLLRRTDA